MTKKFEPIWGRHPSLQWVLYKITNIRTSFRYFRTRKAAQEEGYAWVGKMIKKNKTAKMIVKKRPSWK